MCLINLVEAEVVNSEIIKIMEIMEEVSIREMKIMTILKRERKNMSKEAEDIIPVIEVATVEEAINIKEIKSVMMIKMKRTMSKIVRVKERLKSLRSTQHRRRVQNGQS